MEQFVIIGGCISHDVSGTVWIYGPDRPKVISSTCCNTHCISWHRGGIYCTYLFGELFIFFE